MTERRQQLAAWLAVVALVAWSAWQRWRLLAVSPFPVGIDGYFYPIELRALLETGHLQYPASPLALWLMAPWPRRPTRSPARSSAPRCSAR